MIDQFLEMLGVELNEDFNIGGLIGGNPHRFEIRDDEDLDRIHTLKEIGYDPYVMIYEKEKLPKKHITKKLQRWVNARPIFGSVPTFNEYLKGVQE